MLEKFNQQIDRLVEAVRNQPKFGWAVVTSVDPLLIRYESETESVLGTPDRLVTGLQVGDRVWVQRQHRRDIVLGASHLRDTGWTAITVNTSLYNIVSQPYARISNGRVELAGEIERKTGNPPQASGGELCFTLPDNRFRPYSYFRAPAGAYGSANANSSWLVMYSSTNTVNIFSAGLGMGTAYLSHISYVGIEHGPI